MSRRLWLSSAYAIVLCSGTALVALLPGDREDALLHGVSTNLDNLADGRLDTLVTSALFAVPRSVGGVVLSLVVLAAAERALGPLRTGAVFALGHVGASVVVGILLAGEALPGVASDAVRTAIDVGPSYGTAAVAGLLAVAVGRSRPAALLPAALVAGLSLVRLLEAPTFTDWGHLLALLLGAGAGAGLALAPRSGRPA